ncbi:MAG: aspartate-semialdehyde dehydrogenase [Chitinophagaceae bacterium]|nr:aspartate-semialdehyde dehydrogenase [Chitinophagaceae bacterium]
MKIAIVGVTGLVGNEILKVIKERNWDKYTFLMVASERSVGKIIEYRDKKYEVIGLQKAVDLKPNIAIFSAGGSVSLEWAPKFEKAGATVIDNSSAWRMSLLHKLIVPEINAHILTPSDKIIANPNCSTIQMVMVLSPLHQKYTIKRIVVSTYQSVTGTGKKGVDQLMGERNSLPHTKIYPHPIDMNVLPQVDVFLPNGYTKEEMKMVNETKKILDDQTIQITATAVRVPSTGGHSEAINVEFAQEYDLQEVKNILSQTPGLIVMDNHIENIYPMPIITHGKDEVFVGRIRRDESLKNSLNLWVVADNLRKGAATNAVQIAEYILQNNILL